MNPATARRLQQAGLWEPSTALRAVPTAAKTEEARARALLAERAAWIKSAGRRGWQQELDRRRAARTARSSERLASRTK